MPLDTEASVGLKKKIEKWVRDINSVKTELTRSVPLTQDSITAIALHAFVDVSIVTNCATFYVVVHQFN